MSAIAGEGKHVWTFVGLVVNRPWFLVTYSREGEGCETLLLSSVDQVVDVLAKHRQEINVDQLQLVSPKSLNRSENWLMEPLSEVWRSAAENDKVMVYYLEDGRCYIDSFRLPESSQTGDLACIIRFNKGEGASNAALASGTH